MASVHKSLKLPRTTQIDIRPMVVNFVLIGALNPARLTGSYVQLRPYSRCAWRLGCGLGTVSGNSSIGAGVGIAVGLGNVLVFYTCLC